MQKTTDEDIQLMHPMVFNQMTIDNMQPNRWITQDRRMKKIN
jgi:hypothetical protein